MRNGAKRTAAELHNAGAINEKIQYTELDCDWNLISLTQWVKGCETMIKITIVGEWELSTT